MIAVINDKNIKRAAINMSVNDFRLKPRAGGNAAVAAFLVLKIARLFGLKHFVWDCNYTSLSLSHPLYLPSSNHHLFSKLLEGAGCFLY